MELSSNLCWSKRAASLLRFLGRAILAVAVFIAGQAVVALDLRKVSTEHLDNGLTVMLLPDRNRSLVSVQVLYRVGASNEVSGKTGLAHFLEHMAFRDSVHFPDNGLVEAIYARGGEWHGYTWTEQTTYFATVPRDDLDLLLRIEADRMSRLVISEVDMEAERGAVLAEMHMYENDPASRLLDALMATSFLAHPYRNNTIGWQGDIEALRHEDVLNFYRQHYQPANAVLVVVGDIDRAKTLARIHELFGGFKGRTSTVTHLTPEPVQNGERRIVLHGPGDSRQFMIAYRAPAVGHTDFPAFLVLQELLGAGSGVNFLQNDWGTPVREGSVLAGTAAELRSWYPPSGGDYLFVIAGTAPAGAVETDLEGEIERRIRAVREKPLATATLEAAIARSLDELIFDVETTEDAAHQLAYFEGLQALDVLLTLPERISLVTAVDVQRVAHNWLQPARRSIAWYRPGELAATSPPLTVAAAPMSVSKRSAPAQPLDEQPLPAPVLRKLGGGIPLILQRADLSPTLQLQIILPGTNIAADHLLENEPVTGYSSLLFRRRADELAALVDEARVTLATARYTKARTPVPATDPETRLEQAFRRHMGVNDAAVSGAARPVLIVISGDVDVASASSALEQAFATVPAGSPGVSTLANIGRGEDKVALGFAPAQARLAYIVSAPGPGQPGYAAMRFLQYIFAHDYAGRLGGKAITQQGLAYYIDSRYRSDGHHGWMTLGIGVDVDKLDDLRSLMAAELQRLQSEAPSVTEVEEARSHFIGRLQSATQSNAELADELARHWLWQGELLNRETLARRLAAVTREEVLAAVPAFISGLSIVVAE